MLNNTPNSIQPSTATKKALSSVSSAVNDMGVQIYNNLYLISIAALIIALELELIAKAVISSFFRTMEHIECETIYRP